ncbi:MAG TPA: hypothetical protein DEA96_03850 [Leptospiraceae bacterium]|nr:hypothetical protein [Spirochaetaceae bacterium]HBS04075.1 hypothetical protein [Leptospiraceae bacterium]|tara:strand:+ start:294 stop:545 length:252 start_codon:yes stop_codon:yes gene_type:complete
MQNYAMAWENEVDGLKKRVGKLERTVEFLLRELKLEYVDDPAAGAHPEVLRLLNEGKETEAVMKYREITGASLADAKRAVQRM